MMYSDTVLEKKSGKSKKEAVKFVNQKKKDMKESKYRKKFDSLAREIEDNLVNTEVTYGTKRRESSGFSSFVMMSSRDDGTYDLNVYPNRVNDNATNEMGSPKTQEPIAFSKILIATSILFGKVPDGKVFSHDKVYARTMYELWKDTWKDRLGNGKNTLIVAGQNLVTFGWSAWRVYPRKEKTKRDGVDKILFDGIYREPLDPRRTWLGTSFNNGDVFSQFEVYYEKDIAKDEFEKRYPKAKTFNGKLSGARLSSSDEAKDENSDKAYTHYTIGYYESVLENRFIAHCGDFLIYDGELPNDENFGSVVVSRFTMRDMNDPYGVGLYEMMRGNTALYTYLNSLNTQQIEAEIHPLIFGTQSQNGTATYRRGPGIVNPKNPGTELDIVHTTGNVPAGINFANAQKQVIEENTGVNNIVSGTGVENTLGATVIQKEAANNRMTPARNSVVDALSLDGHMCFSWIKQIYPYEDTMVMKSYEDVQKFAEVNPQYMVQAEPVVEEDGTVNKHLAVITKGLNVSFDFSPDGEVIELQDPVRMPANAIFDLIDKYEHTADNLDLVIDGNSMLLPSEEIEKQNFMAIFPVIQNSVTTIFAMKREAPDAAAAQLKTLEQFLEIQKQNIFDYIPKSQYDVIMQGADQAQPAMPPEMQAMMGGEEEPMTEDGTPPMQPQNPEEVRRPQSPLGASTDASLGRANAQPEQGFTNYQ